MKKFLLSVFVVLQLTTMLYANEDMLTEEIENIEAKVPHFYIIGKGLMIRGDSVEHGEATLNGNRDYGYGVDIGYHIGKGFSLEYDFTSSRNTVRETKPGHEPEDIEGKYYTSAIDLVYSYELTKHLAVFGKVGYEYEWEEIDEINIDKREHGAIVGVGVEIAMNKKFAFMLEYEHSSIEGPRGDSIFAGILFRFDNPALNLPTLED
jgi:opacity protein-like surface antigen